MRNQSRYKPMCVADIADGLDISTQRVRQLIQELGAEPVSKIGNVPFYGRATWIAISNRNKKPGPRNGKKGK